MIDTGGTLCKAAEALKKRGAVSVKAFATHPIFSGKALENIANSELEEVIVCDSVPLSDEARNIPKIKQLSLAPLIAEAVEGYQSIDRAGTLRDAVELAAGNAEAGEVVLLSPACASFDMFADYQDRGRQFKALVNGLP